MLYRVQFRQIDVWPDYAGPPQDTLQVEVYENWLEAAAEEAA
jgi:nitrile hydratase